MSQPVAPTPAPHVRSHAAVTPPPAISASPQRLLQDWRSAHARAVAYAAGLGVPENERRELALRAVTSACEREWWPSRSDAITETLATLRATVGGSAASFPPLAPPLARRPMLPAPISGARAAARKRHREAPATSSPRQKPAVRWRRVALRRRLLLALLVLLPSVVAVGFMQEVLPHQGSTTLELAIVLVFGALFGWISIGFWTALLGFWLLLRGRDRFAITWLARDAAREGSARSTLPGDARTAIVMPICEEPVDRVFAGLRAIRASLERTGYAGHFDFFVLSDSQDPSTCADEVSAWDAWCRDAGGHGWCFYRRRRVRLKKKSGNVADFCRRWGSRYRYMVVLDADSLMSGDTIVRLVRIMERRPDAGMVQTVPVSVNRHTLFARVQQLAGRLYGPMWSAGLHFWQLGDGQYWGHNTIIRVAPFMAHCGLPRLSGSPPLGGDILSHDFVEAALLGRAGWTLWLAYDLGGSYEEAPSTLLEEMQRDRRWCQGNLQHLRLLFAPGMYGAHRALFLNGVFSYSSALLWLCFLMLSTAAAIVDVITPPAYFSAGPSLFPDWPVFRPHWAGALLATTFAILFLPKVLALLLAATRQGGARAYGGTARLAAGVAGEILVSSVLAPIRMLFHSKFVVSNLLGRTVGWRSQERTDSQTTWRQALRHHGVDTLLASLWGLGLFALNPGYFWWLTPTIGALVLSVPVSVLASRTSLGERARRCGLFLTPEERDPPVELVGMRSYLADMRAGDARRSRAEQDGFVRAVVDPHVHALHCTIARGPRSLHERLRAKRRVLVERALEHGPGALRPTEQHALLRDRELLESLHQRVWALADHPGDPWGIAERVRRVREEAVEMS